MENLHASNRSVIGFSYVAVCLLFSSLFFISYSICVYDVVVKFTFAISHP